MSFPGDRFVSMADYLAWSADHQALLRSRELATRFGATQPPQMGSCSPCLRATRLTEGRCDCPDRLEAADRALLHAAEEEAGLCGWSRLLLLGALTETTRGVFARLAALAGTVAWHQSPAAAARIVPVEVAVGRLSPCEVAAYLAGLRQALVQGGCLLAAIDFNPQSRRGDATGFGWDLLDQVRTSGFASAMLIRAWSRELGYVGDLHFLKAVA